MLPYVQYVQKFQIFQQNLKFQIVGLASRLPVDQLEAAVLGQDIGHGVAVGDEVLGVNVLKLFSFAIRAGAN